VIVIALIRHWGLPVNAAFHPEVRETVTVVAAAEKIAFSLNA
jgi:hypothetical protein